MDAREIDGRHDSVISETLRDGWDRVLSRGGFGYDPAPPDEIRVGRIRFVFLPNRLRRPGAGGGAPGEHGVVKPHTACPFDDPRVLDLREVARFRRQGRVYHLITNKFPVKPLHFLAVRSLDAPAQRLPQCLLDADEIEDMALLARSLGPPYRFFFNSNAGIDFSHSGSSVNHWHFQLFPDAGDVLETVCVGDRTIDDWPGAHTLRVSSDAADIATSMWEIARRANELNVAYTLAVRSSDEGLLAAAFFARAPLDPLPVPGGGELSNRFGGFEVTGAVVVYDPAVFEWVRAHPEDALELARARLRAGTRPLPPADVSARGRAAAGP